MNNYNKLDEQAKKQVDELIESLLPKFDWGEFYPKEIGTYFYIDDKGIVWTVSCNCGCDIELGQVQQGNTFFDKQEAEKETKRRQAVTKWNLIAKKLNDGWVEDWEDDEVFNYFPAYHSKTSKYGYEYDNTCKTFPYTHLKSSELCLQAINTMDIEDMKLLLGVE